MTTREMILSSYDANIQAASGKLQEYYRRERAAFVKRARARDEQEKPKTRTDPNWDRFIENESL